MASPIPENFANELWTEVFYHFNKLSDLAKVGAVCRRWREIIQNDSIWKTVHYNSFSLYSSKWIKPDPFSWHGYAIKIYGPEAYEFAEWSINRGDNLEQNHYIAALSYERHLRDSPKTLPLINIIRTIGLINYHYQSSRKKNQHNKCVNNSYAKFLADFKLNIRSA